MKHKIYPVILALLFVILAAKAQDTPYETIVDGVKVIVQPSGNAIVEIQAVVKGGVQNYPAEKAGIEALAFRALTECGTLKHDKNAFKDILDKVSAQMFGSVNKDYSVFRMNCIKSDFSTVWPLFIEALTQPKFDEKEFARIKQDAINNLKAQESRPDAAIDTYADKVAFAGRDYAKNPNGTTETIQNLTLADVKAFYSSILTKGRMVIVIVADMDRAAIESNVKSLLAGIKPGSPYTLKKASFRIYKNTFSAMPKELATNYIEGVTSGPQPGTPDFNAFNVAMRIFADRHFLEVRTNNGLSYAPQAWFSNGSTSVAKFAVSTTEPNKYIAVFDKLVDKIKTEGFTAAEVKNMKNTYLTGFYYRQETNAAQASALVANEVVHSNWKRSVTLVNDVKKLTLEDVNIAFRNYIGNTAWVYQGDPKKVNAIDFINGTVKKAANPVGN